MDQLKGATITISKLFSADYFLRVPEYQRPFSWEEDNFIDLVNDLSDADRDKQYFLGTIVLQKKNEINNYDIVDGQQRLTAISILLASIRDLIEDEEFKRQIQEKILQKKNDLDNIPEKIRLEVNDRKIYSDCVVNNGGTLAKIDINNLSKTEMRYINAIKIFSEKINKLNQDELKRFANFISTKCVFILLEALTFEDAFKLFTIINDRGKQLRRIDILKSVNISPDVINNEELRKKISYKWEEMEKRIGEDIFENILHIIRLILTKDKPQSDLLKEFDERIFKRNILSRGEKFVDFVEEYVLYYEKIFDDGDAPFDDEYEKNKFNSLIYIMNSEFKASEWKACVLFFAKKFECKSIYKFLLKIEKIYMVQWVKGMRKDERFSEYSKILHLIEDKNKVDDILNNISFDCDVILDACDNKNFYGSGYAKYFLLRLELLSSEFDSPIFFSPKSIEHVLPQSPDPKSDWGKWNDLSSIDEYVNTVGNLVLLSKKKNASARNFDFEKKKKTYLEPRVSLYPRSLGVLKEKMWGKETIELRTANVKKRILQEL